MGMHEPSFPDDDPLFLKCDSISAAVIYGLAVYTLLYHISLLSGLSLLHLTGLALLCLVGWLGWSVRTGLRRRKETPIKRKVEPRLWLPLAGLAVACVAISLLTNKPDADDVTYLARTVWNFEHATSSLRWNHPFALSPDMKLFSEYTMASYEHLCASLALLTGARPVEVYHFLMPVLGGALTPIVWFVLLRRLQNDTKACLFGTLAVVVFLCADGSALRSVGNFSLVRIWQGKTLLLALWTPLCIGYILDLLRGNFRVPLCRLAALSISGVGLSSTAIFYLPFLYAVAAGSYFLVNVRRTSPRNFIIGGLAVSTYPAVWALTIHRIISVGMPVKGEAMANIYPYLFAPTFALVYGSPPGVAFYAGLISMITLLLLRRWNLLKWIIVWTILVVVFLSLPVVAKWIAAHWAARIVSWRLLFALPMPLVLGLATAGCFAANRSLRTVVSIALVICIPVTGYLAITKNTKSPWGRKGYDFPATEFPAVGLKLPSDQFEWSRIIESQFEGGNMLSPVPISSVLPVLTARFPQYTFRAMVVVPGTPSETMWLATRFLDGKDLSLKAFQALCDAMRHDFRYVVMRHEALMAQGTRDLLRNSGFVFKGRAGPYYKVFENKKFNSR